MRKSYLPRVRAIPPLDPRWRHPRFFRIAAESNEFAKRNGLLWLS